MTIQVETQRSTQIRKQMQAEDKDLAEAGQVRYTLDELTTDSQFFTLDSRTGELKNARPMTSIPQVF